MVKADEPSSSEGAEQNSPSQMTPGLVEHGLSPRALPSPIPPGERPELNLETFYWDTHPFENAALMVPSELPGPGQSFRPVTSYSPVLGLKPKVYREGRLEFYPWGGISQSFDSNVQLSQKNPISDFYATPRFGLETQLGSADSIYSGYDTIFAAHLSYEGYADLFYEHPNFTAYNSQLDFNARIGRDRLIVRPFLNFSDITGNNLQLLQLQNRSQRIQTYAGAVGEYAFTPITSWRQTFNVLDFVHPEQTNVSYVTWATRQELTYLLPNNMSKAILWFGASTTSPNHGFGGNEYSSGVGWEGQFGERLSSELRIGYGQVQMDGHVANRWNMSGLRYGGHVTFDWTERIRFTFLYDRDYVYNESGTNDNYIATLTQFKTEIYMGNNWLLIPYLGTSFEHFQTSHQLEMDLRPELELAYIFSKETYEIVGLGDKSAASRIFVKVGYDFSENISGPPGGFNGVRVSTGFNWNF